MKILVVQESDWIERNPIQQHHMLERLSAQGHDVLVTDYPIRWRDTGSGLLAGRRTHQGVSKVVPDTNVTVIRTAMVRVPGIGKLAWLATNSWEIGRVLRRYKPDVVVLLGLTNSLAALTMAKLAGVPTVVHLVDALHTLVEPPMLRPAAAFVERKLLRHADCVVVINDALATYAEGMGTRRERITKVPTGVDLDRYGPHVDGSCVRDEYGIAPDDHVLLFVGWLYSFSGLKELAEAMAADPVTTKGVRLFVVGDGDLMPELARLRDEHLGGRLILAGKQPAERMPEIMASADVCLLPAHLNEMMAHIVPAKIYEYLSAGKPVIASPLPGLKAEFGECAGIRYVDDSTALLADARLLLSNADLLGSVETSSRRTAESNGTWEQAAGDFLRILVDAATRRTPASNWLTARREAK